MLHDQTNRERKTEIAQKAAAELMDNGSLCVAPGVFIDIDTVTTNIVDHPGFSAAIVKMYAGDHVALCNLYSAEAERIISQYNLEFMVENDFMPF